jgi:hypothetical protein
MVSYNVLPGCRIRQVVRECLLPYLPPADQPEARLAAVPPAMAALIEAWAEGDALQAAVREEMRVVGAREPEVLFHDELAETYAPAFLEAVVAAAGRHGLAYLADIEPARVRHHLHPDDWREQLSQAGGDPVRLEQLDDVATLRRFRQSLFRRAESAPLVRDPAEALSELFVSGEFTPPEIDAQGVHTYRDPHDSSFRTNNPGVIALLARLSDAFPAALPTAELTAEPWAAQVLLRLYGANLIELRTAPGRFVATAGERPTASPLARLQAGQDRPGLSSLRHITVQVENPAARTFVTLLDGSLDRAALAEAVRERTGVQPSPAQVEQNLAGLARLGLLTA